MWSKKKRAASTYVALHLLHNTDNEDLSEEQMSTEKYSIVFQYILGCTAGRQALLTCNAVCLDRKAGFVSFRTSNPPSVAAVILPSTLQSGGSVATCPDVVAQMSNYYPLSVETEKRLLDGHYC